jgi:hypothetical protein
MRKTLRREATFEHRQSRVRPLWTGKIRLSVSVSVFSASAFSSFVFVFLSSSIAFE